MRLICSCLLLVSMFLGICSQGFAKEKPGDSPDSPYIAPCEAVAAACAVPASERSGDWGMSYRLLAESSKKWVQYRYASKQGTGDIKTYVQYLNEDRCRIINKDGSGRDPSKQERMKAIELLRQSPHSTAAYHCPNSSSFGDPFDTGRFFIIFETKTCHVVQMWSILSDGDVL